MNQIDQLIRTAAAEIGYLEKSYSAYKARPSVIYEKTAGAGNDNVTKYGADLRAWIPEAGDTYGIDYQWCDQFVDWCMVRTFGKEEAKRLLIGWSAYTPTSSYYFKSHHQWHTEPKRGDIIFFRNSERICHTGIVYEVEGDRVLTIEGNTSSVSGVVSNGGCVARKAYDKSNSRIAGYGRPAYKAESKEWEGVDKDRFIRNLYTDVLLREATADEVANWKTDIAEHDRTADEMQDIFRNSPEGRAAWVRMLYGVILGREAGVDEIAAWTGAMERGESREEVMRDIQNSPEAQTK